MKDVKIEISYSCLLNFNHQIRNSLNKVMGLISLLECHQSEKEKNTLTKLLIESTLELYKNIDDILELKEK